MNTRQKKNFIKSQKYVTFISGIATPIMIALSLYFIKAIYDKNEKTYDVQLTMKADYDVCKYFNNCENNKQNANILDLYRKYNWLKDEYNYLFHKKNKIYENKK